MSVFFERAEAPALELQAPVCLGCNNEVLDQGDGWECHHCHAHWPPSDGWDGTPWEYRTGEYLNVDVPACGALRAIGGEVHRCVLDLGHATAEMTDHISTCGCSWDAIKSQTYDAADGAA